jgi:hypothetical protein
LCFTAPNIPPPPPGGPPGGAAACPLLGNGIAVAG